jgi:hypothetical protein
MEVRQGKAFERKKNVKWRTRHSGSTSNTSYGEGGDRRMKGSDQLSQKG